MSRAMLEESTANPNSVDAARGSQPTAGLGGWLILGQMMLWWSLIGSVITMVDGMGVLADSLMTVKSSLVDNGIASASSVTSWFIFMLVIWCGNLAIIILNAIALMLLYRRKRLFIRFVRIYWWMVLCLSVIAFLYPIATDHVSSMAQLYVKLIENLIICCIWLLYYSRSSRVKHTFIR
ncbi:magnesium-transporting ATPase (P-type) [Paenibacillus phyllosphaerae]|uniref:Magnesium-transporting ATPase (P-type) n=1 Tax=Paenibacillus phyllosphaerae TaxID=274593 RepID=A0A7W5B4R4_9BACL|nr:DUF2569 family protein [Paenibacillus phyllosphaerae]MBB3114382.1 magnesium-transporting ATPase (P-type) [Paenibacillus phyllosphaerae]